MRSAKLKRTLVSLTERQVRLIEQQAKESELGYSETLRRILDEYFKGKKE